MRVILNKPDNIFEKYSKDDPRDAFSVSRRFDYLTAINHKHEMAIEAGGPEVLERRGLPWKKYNSKEELLHDCREIHRLRTLYGQDCMLISGDRGAGKTLLAVYFALRFFIIGYNVISNISLDFGYRLSDGSDMLGLIKSDHNTYWIVDEIHQMLNRFRQGAKFQKEIIGAIAGMRKNLSGLSGITSQDWQLGMDVKSQFKWAFYPWRKPRHLCHPSLRAHWVPPYMRTHAWRIGPWPEEWRGSTLADKRKLPFVRGGDSEEIQWIPEPLRLLYIVPALYGSYVSLPTAKESGANILAAQMRLLDIDNDIHYYDSVDAMNRGVGDTADTLDNSNKFQVSFDKYFYEYLVAPLLAIYPNETRVNRSQLVSRINADRDFQSLDPTESQMIMKRFMGEGTTMEVKKVGEMREAWLVSEE